MSNALLKIENLSVDFHTEHHHIVALDNISFEIKTGETIAIVGESGSGKSLLALSILQLLPSTAMLNAKSKIIFEIELQLIGQENKKLQSIRGNQIAMIFQEPMTSLNPLMRCGEQVSESLRLHLKLNPSKAKQKTLSIFEEVKINNPEATYLKYPHELSGGQKQRVMIAMAICCHPKILIADEPTTALDVRVQKSILNLLKELQATYKMSTLFITHDLKSVKTFADTVIVMHKGKCVENGNTNDIFNNPQHAYTKALINCRPDNNVRQKYLANIDEFMNENISIENRQIITVDDFAKKIASIEHSKNLFEINNLSVWYPVKKNFFGKTTSWFKAVNDVNIQIKKGETMGLVGESGCGKTTIGKAIVRLVDITNGSIKYNGKNIVDFSKSELYNYQKEVQIIFQDPYSSLNPRMTIGNAIKEPMDVHQIENVNNRKEKVISLLEKVGLQADHYQRYPHEFSGGQRQRICIARALALQPKFIICDESVSALDVSVQAQVLNLLVSLKEEFEMTYLFISHDLNVIKHVSDHVAVMYNGNIIEQNNSDDLFNNPKETYSKELINSI